MAVFRSDTSAGFQHWIRKLAADDGGEPLLDRVDLVTQILLNNAAVALEATESLSPTIFTNTSILQASAASYEDFAHGIGEQFVQVTVIFKPSAGTYSGQWINAEGVVTIVYLNVNTIRIYNESAAAIAIGDFKLVVYPA